MRRSRWTKIFRCTSGSTNRLAMVERTGAGIPGPAAARGSHWRSRCSRAIPDRGTDGRVEGQSYGEIAESLCVPIGTVRSRLARGRALLQRALWEHACNAGLRSESLERRPGSH